jgi:hypothetical protein
MSCPLPEKSPIFASVAQIQSLCVLLLQQVILVMIAFSTFWISPECGERLGLAVTIPLAVAVYDLLVFGTLPSSNRINFVSAMGLLGFMFSMFVLLENALVIQLYYYRWVWGLDLTTYGLRA